MSSMDDDVAELLQALVMTDSRQTEVCKEFVGTLSFNLCLEQI